MSKKLKTEKSEDVPTPKIRSKVKGKDDLTHKTIYAKKGTPGFTPSKK